MGPRRHSQPARPTSLVVAVTMCALWFAICLRPVERTSFKAHAVSAHSPRVGYLLHPSPLLPSPRVAIVNDSPMNSEGRARNKQTAQPAQRSHSYHCNSRPGLPTPMLLQLQWASPICSIASASTPSCTCIDSASGQITYCRNFMMERCWTPPPFSPRRHIGTAW